MQSLIWVISEPVCLKEEDAVGFSGKSVECCLAKGGILNGDIQDHVSYELGERNPQCCSVDVLEGHPSSGGMGSWGARPKPRATAAAVDLEARASHCHINQAECSLFSSAS